MVTCTRKLEFDAGHRVFGHEGKCATLHGHRYTAEITCRADDLDNLGRVVDFSKIKEVVGGWIDAHWDHTTILNGADTILTLPEWHEICGPRPTYVMAGNPTAENMAAELFHIATALLQPYHITVSHVRLYETVSCWADFSK